MKGLKRPKIVFHFSFFLFLGASIIIGRGVIFALYFLCLVLHEMVHGYVAKKRGYETNKIVLSASGALLEASSDEFSFGDEIIIALSAPLFNLSAGLFIVALWWIFPESYNYTLDLCVINFAIFAFNMLPVFPLDGGRVLLAFLSKRVERKTAVKISRMVTIGISLAIFLLFIFSLFSSPNFSLGLIAIMLFISGVSEDKMTFYKRSIYLLNKGEKAKKRGIETRFVAVNYAVEKSRLYGLLSPKNYTIFLLVDENFNLKGKITESELMEEVKRLG